MPKKLKIILFVLLTLIIAVIVVLFFHNHSLAVLSPKGPIAQKERTLMIIAAILMLVVIIPVFTLTFGIVYKYRASNKKATYSPDWDHSRIVETIWWTIPVILIITLGVITWQSTHALDPYKPLVSKNKPMTIQVVALQWKWLFIYPEQNIASVNYVQFPSQTPINFVITADAPMNSFWIPQLGGQIYAMPGMSTQLHLMADNNGSYYGSSANISGVGFAGMNFTAKSTSQDDFNNWVRNVKQSPNKLSFSQYNTLAQPSTNNPPVYYSSKEAYLYNTIVMKYMMPTNLISDFYGNTTNNKEFYTQSGTSR